jgi:SpoVK/Ycf46/Vps4 family AAA+-type ATPase
MEYGRGISEKLRRDIWTLPFRTGRCRAFNRSTSWESRFHEPMVIPLPDQDARIRLLTVMLACKKLDFSAQDGAMLLADLTEGWNWSGRDLEGWVSRAEQKALLEAIRAGGPEHYVIKMDDFEVAPH